jgi:hypothetical protein
MSNVKLLNLSVSCEFDVLVVLLVIFFQFFYILITFHLTTVFIKIKKMSLIELHNLFFFYFILYLSVFLTLGYPKRTTIILCGNCDTAIKQLRDTIGKLRRHLH